MTALLLILLLEPKDALKDDYWGYAIKLPGLEKVLGLGDSAVLYRGRAGKLRVSVKVHETAVSRGPALWIADLRKRVQDRLDEKSGTHWITYSKKDRLGFTEHYGHAYFVRGAQCFEWHVHSGGDAAAVRAALDAFELKPDAPGTLTASLLARKRKRPADDPHVLLAAGFDYLTGQRYHRSSKPLAAKVLAQARARMRPDTFKPLELWSLYEYGGLALSDRPKKAIEWHALAEKAAGKLKERPGDYRRKSAFNLACAYAGAEKPDEAFAALYRAYDGGVPVSRAQVSNDRRLEGLRRDKRWEKFWRECVTR